MRRASTQEGLSSFPANGCQYPRDKVVCHPSINYFASRAGIGLRHKRHPKVCSLPQQHKTRQSEFHLSQAHKASAGMSLANRNLSQMKITRKTDEYFGVRRKMTSNPTKDACYQDFLPCSRGRNPGRPKAWHDRIPYRSYGHQSCCD